MRRLSAGGSGPWSPSSLMSSATSPGPDGTTSVRSGSDVPTVRAMLRPVAAVTPSSRGSSLGAATSTSPATVDRLPTTEKSSSAFDGSRISPCTVPISTVSDASRCSGREATPSRAGRVISAQLRPFRSRSPATPRKSSSCSMEHRSEGRAPVLRIASGPTSTWRTSQGHSPPLPTRAGSNRVEPHSSAPPRCHLRSRPTTEPLGVVGFRVVLGAYRAAGMAAMGPVSLAGWSSAMEVSDR